MTSARTTQDEVETTSRWRGGGRTTPLSASGSEVVRGLSLLPQTLDVAAMTRALSPVLDARDPTSGGHVVTSARLVACKEGHRALVAYRVERCADGSASQVMGKLFGDPVRARRLLDTLSALWIRRGSGGAPVVPEPLGLVPELSLVLYSPVEGVDLDQGLRRRGAARLLHMTGRALLALHALDVPLERSFDPATEMATVGAWAQAIAALDSDLGREARATADILAQRSALMSVDSGAAIHKDFHPQHVIVGSRIGFIDLDEMRCGDALFDIAHFCVHLDLLSMRMHASEARRRDLRRWFMGGYFGERAGGSDPRLDLFSAYACLKVARQLSVSRGVGPRPTGAERYRQTAAMVTGARRFATKAA